MGENYKVISFFAGVGGIDLGFEQGGPYKTVYANEFDKNAQETFAANFGEEILDRRDIRQVEPTDGILGQTEADVLLAGFPCQAFSIAGYRKGFEDERGDLFFETMRIVKEKQPAVVFLENVKNLVTHDGGNTFKVIREFLVHAGYHIKWSVLNAKDYGNTPQNRERIYVVGFKDKESFERFEFPQPIELTTKLRDVIDFGAEKDTRYYYEEGKHAFYPELVENMTSQDTTYQWRRQYVRENKSGVVPTLTANMGTGGHNVPLILTDDRRIRKLTPRETFNVQGYPEEYILPEQIAHGQLYKQAGNSVAVPVIRRIAQQITKALESSNLQKELPPVDQKPAIIRTKMIGRMAGGSYTVKFFESETAREDWLADNQSMAESGVLGLPVFSNKDFFDAVKRGSNVEFLSLVG